MCRAAAHDIGVIGTESFAGKACPMVWLYLFNAEAETVLARDEPAWNEWME